MTTTTEKFNTLGIETVQTALDTAYFVQRQNTNILSNVLNTVEANQQVSRELVGRWIKQSQDAQKLWLQWWQDSARTATETWSNVVGTGFQAAGEGITAVRNGAHTAAAGK